MKIGSKLGFLLSPSPVSVPCRWTRPQETSFQRFEDWLRLRRPILTHSLTHSLIHSFILQSIHSLTHPSVLLSIHLFSYPSIHSLICPFIPSLIHLTFSEAPPKSLETCRGSPGKLGATPPFKDSGRLQKSKGGKALRIRMGVLSLSVLSDSFPPRGL